MDKDTAKALMRAEAAEALLEELRDKLEVLEAENAELKAQLEGKPAPAKPEPNKLKTGHGLARTQRIMDELIIYEGFEKIDPKFSEFSEELLRQIMEQPPGWLDREIRREREQSPRNIEFRVREHPFNGDIVISMHYEDAGKHEVLSYAMPRGRIPPRAIPEEAARHLLAELSKKKELGAPPKEVFNQVVRDIERAMNKARGRKW